MLNRRFLTRTISQCTLNRVSLVSSHSIRYKSTDTDSNPVETSETVYKPTHPLLQLNLEPPVLPPMPIFPIARVGNKQPLQTAIDLAEWLFANGGQLHPKVILGSITQLKKKGASDDGNWGGMAFGPILKDEIIASIPIKCCIFPLERSPTKHDDMFYQGIAGLIANVDPTFWQLRLGLRLLAERASEKSFFAPYINALPSNFPDVPVFYNKEAADMTQYRPFLQELHRRSSAIHSLVKNVDIGEPGTPPSNLSNAARYGLAAFNGYQVTAGDIAWSTSAVSSRAFSSPIPPSENARTVKGDIGGADSKCLIPIADMLNHSYDNNSRIAFSRDKSLGDSRDAYRVLIRATRDIEPYEEITLNYFKPNATATPLSLADLIPTPENEEAKVNAILNADSPSSLFQASLCRVNGVYDYPAGLQSEVFSEDVLLNFGFVAPFNIKDNLIIKPEDDLLNMALEMSHDYTLAHDYLSKTAAENDQRAPLVLPLPKTNHSRDSLLQAAIETVGACTLSWTGPNDNLMVVLRAAAIGTHRPLFSNMVEGDSEHSAGVVQKEVDHRTTMDLVTLDEKARAVLATKGFFIHEREVLDSHMLVEGLGSKLSDENEEAAMYILYGLCVMSSGTFQHKLSHDYSLLMNAIRLRDTGMYTATLFGRQKKTLLDHAMKSLATKLRLDTGVMKWHKNME